MGSWEYSGDPATSVKDEVRFLIGDTNPDDPQMSDEEVLYLIGANGGAISSAVAALQTLGARFTNLAVKSKAVGDLRIEYNDRAQGYLALADMLGGGVLAVNPIPQATGIRISDKQAADLDTDRVQPSFKVGRDDYPGQDPDQSLTKDWTV